MANSQNHDVGRTTSGSQNHEVQTAIILAAGMGVRLKDRGKLTPKGCLCLGKQSIVEESIIRLLGVGIQRIVIVTGHLAEQYQPLQDRYGDTVQLVHNPHFANSGSMYSLYCARHSVDEAFLLLESDIIYEHRALTTCLECPSSNVALLAGFSESSDEVFVETRNRRLVAMSKERDHLGSEVFGELVGICKISRSLFYVMLDLAARRFRTTRHMDYETDCLVAARHMDVSCPVVEDLVWCEIDDASHLARARNEIYPAVHQLDMDRSLLHPLRIPVGIPPQRVLEEWSDGHIACPSPYRSRQLRDLDDQFDSTQTRMDDLEANDTREGPPSLTQFGA